MPASSRNIDPWVLSTTDPKAAEAALLWNGKIGLRLNRSGSPIGNDGKSLAAFSISNYEPDGEEKILAHKDWYRSRAAQPTFIADLVSNYEQSLDMRTGILETKWVNTEKGRRLQITRESIVDPYGNPVWGERWTTKTATAQDRRSKTEQPIKDQFSQSFYLPNDLDGGNPPAEDFAAMETRAITFWEEFWRTDIEIDGPVEDQQAIRSFLFYLRTAIDPQEVHPVSPMGLSNSIYFGHVFWDADIWVFPALMLLDPDRAATIPLYRLAREKGARENYLDWVKKGRPIGTGAPLGNAPPDPRAIMFPWESSVSGKETVPGPSRFQHHISGSVLFGLANAMALGMIEVEDYMRILGGVKAFYKDRATKNPDGTWEFKGTMSPDEHHTGDNDLYTNILANWVLSNGRHPSTGPFKLPRDERSFITYDNDHLKTYKQAAALLSVFPLQFGPAEAEAAELMERFGTKTIRNGPAMSDSVHATILARIGKSDQGYATWRRSWSDFTKSPLMLFSEKRTSARTYFLTGAGGSLQTVLYGFAGLRVDTNTPEESKWSIPLKAGRVLSCSPSLPSAWKSIKIRGLSAGDKRYTLTITNDAVEVTPMTSEF